MSSRMRTEPFVWVATAILCGGMATVRLAANSVLRILAANHPRAWKHYGSPSGFFSPPRGRFACSWRNVEIFNRWLLRTPRVFVSDEAALRRLSLMRWGMLVMFGGFLLLGIAVWLA